jgi:carbamoyl-phosphate synthase large subunit
VESILVFGAGELQCSLINTVKRMGFRALVIDPDPEAEGADLADVFISIAGDDYEGTRKIALDYSVVALVTAATDNPLPLMAKLAEELGLRFPSYESVMAVLDKGRFKKLLLENNIPCAKGTSYSIDELPDYDSLEYPVIIKPNKNSGSRGVVKCNNREELEAEVLRVKQFCRDGKYIIEQYIEGDEISVEGLVINGKLEIIQITDKILGPPPYNVEMGHIQPSTYWHRKAEIQDLLQPIISISGLDHCAVHPELKINESGVYIIEIGPRLGGDFITSDLVPLSTGIDIEEAMVFMLTGLIPSLKRTERASSIIYFDFYSSRMKYDSITETQVKQLCPNVHRIKIYLKSGETPKSITNSLNRHGYWIMSNESKKALEQERENYSNILSELIFGNEVKT